jgi:hypothetical protein
MIPTELQAEVPKNVAFTGRIKVPRTLNVFLTGGLVFDGGLNKYQSADEGPKRTNRAKGRAAQPVGVTATGQFVALEMVT